MMKIGSMKILGISIATILALAVMASVLSSIWFLEKREEEVMDSNDNAKKASMALKATFWLLVACIVISVLGGGAVLGVRLRRN